MHASHKLYTLVSNERHQVENPVRVCNTLKNNGARLNAVLVLNSIFNLIAFLFFITEEKNILSFGSIVCPWNSKK